PGARAAPGARDGGGWQASIGDLFLNQETEDRLLHDGLLGTGSPLCGAHGRTTGKKYAGAMCVMYRTSAAGLPGDSFRAPQKKFPASLRVTEESQTVRAPAARRSNIGPDAAHGTRPAALPPMASPATRSPARWSA